MCSRGGLIAADIIVLAATWSRLAKDRRKDTLANIYGMSFGEVLFYDGELVANFTSVRVTLMTGPVLGVLYFM